MKTNLFSIILPVIIGLSNFVNAQNVIIPDANFKNYLISVPAINTNSDGQIQVSEAAAFSGTINASYKNISDLSGIEAFTALTGLDCSNNQLTGLDCTFNTSLKTLACRNNQLTGLNVMSNSLLTSISCENNLLPNLNIANNTALIAVSCGNNQLPSLFLDNNTSLQYLYCQDNQLTSLYLHQHLALKELRCNNNQLAILNVKNGNNSNFTAFHAYNNSNLTCITVDNVGYSNSNWSAGKDATVVFSTDCLNLGVAGVEIGDEGYFVYPNPSNGIFTIRSNGDQIVNLYDVNGKSVFNKNIAGTTDINAQELNEGIYTLVLSSEAGVSTKKVVIAR